MFGRSDESGWLAARRDMVDTLRRHGIQDERILTAMGVVPRHRFVPPPYRQADAYGDHPCSIGHGQTISQPFIVAHMSQRLDIRPGMRVLEVGTGCGYQAAVLAQLGARVFTIERIAALGTGARETLEACGYGSVQVRIGDGTEGWPAEAPFEGILVACAAAKLPAALVDQLAEGGRMIIPLGSEPQRLVLVRRHGVCIESIDDLWVRFVPMLDGLA